MTAINRNARVRIAHVHGYLLSMAMERSGLGNEAQEEIGLTAISFAKAMNVVMGAREIWPDSYSATVNSPAYFSLGGREEFGVYFGLIASPSSDQGGYAYPGLRWTYNS